MFNNCQNGRSMVEMLGVLAIVAVLSVGGIAGYSKAMSKYKIGKALNQVQTLVTDIRSLYSGSPNYSNINTGLLVMNEVIPSDMRIGTGPFAKAKNVFGGSVSISQWNGLPYIEGQGFQLIYNGLSKAACIQLASSDWGSANSGFVGMTIKNTTQGHNVFALPDNNWTAGNLPINLNDVSALCTGVNDNSIAWVFR